MSRPKIVRLYGKADNLDIEFTHKGGTTWTCAVPPDFDDGIYAVELTAINEHGEIAYWTGELYMCSGACHIEIMKTDFVFWFAPTTKISIRKGCLHD